MEHQVFGIGHAFGERLVAYVHGITSFLGDAGNPFGKGFFGFLVGRDEACGSVAERVLSVGVYRLLLCESGRRGVLPHALPFVVDFQVTASGRAGIVVYDDFVRLLVPFAGREHYGSCVLQHRDEVGDHDGACVKVFAGAEEAGALPAPFAGLVLVKPAVALPEGDMPPFQPLRDAEGARTVFGPSVVWVPEVSVKAVLVFIFLPVGIRDEVFNGLPVGVEGDVVVIYRSGKRLREGTVDGFYVRFGKRLVPEVVIGIYMQGFLLVVDGEPFQRARADIGIAGLIICKEIFQPVFYIFLKALRRSVEEEETKKEYRIEAFHGECFY